MTEATAYTLLTERAKLAANEVQLPVAFKDVRFPDSDVSSKADEYLEIDFFLNEPSNRALARGGERHLGIYQITLVVTEMLGAAPRLETARQVASFYVKGEKLFGQDASIKITKKPWLGSPLRDGGELRIPITVEYEFFA